MGKSSNGMGVKVSNCDRLFLGYSTLANQPITQCYENEIDNNKYAMKILGKIFFEPLAGVEPTTFQLLFWMF